MNSATALHFIPAKAMNHTDHPKPRSCSTFLSMLGMLLKAPYEYL